MLRKHRAGILSVAQEALMSLTGRFDFRKTLFGKLVLLVEEDVAAHFARWRKRSTNRRWRRANTMDLAAPEMRPLIDLRSQPNYQLANHQRSSQLSSQPLPTQMPDGVIMGADRPNGEARITPH
jgi:hypothetical protein